MNQDERSGRKLLSRRDILKLFGVSGAAIVAAQGAQALGVVQAVADATSTAYLPLISKGAATATPIATTTATTGATATPTTGATATPTATTGATTTPTTIGATATATSSVPTPTATKNFTTLVGVTTNGTPITGLYPIKTTGASTDSVRAAATSFLATLTTAQQTAVTFNIDDDEWRKWSNVDGYQRQGLSLQAMTTAQRTAAMNLLSVALSTYGYSNATNIMKLNLTEGELLSQTSRFNEYLYWFTFMGTPSATEPWGFQLDGHHLVINYFVLGDQVVMTPTFMGAEPPVAPSGTYSGVSVLQNEQNQGLAMIQALTTAQQATAIINASKTGDNLVVGAPGDTGAVDNTVLAYAGIKASALTSAQQTQLTQLIALWVSNMDDAHASVKMAEVQTYLADTYFAWVGATDSTAVFYYRIQSPVILIEFDHELPGPLGQNATYASTKPTRNHIHTIVRTPNGNDYGKTLLAEHYAAYTHVRTADGVTHVPVAAGVSAPVAMGGAFVAGVAGVAAAILPPRYRNGHAVSAAPMAPAPLVYDADGHMAWNHIWGSDDPDSPFCDLALAGGPPHRGSLLEPGTLAEMRADPRGYARVIAELARGLRMVTGLDVMTDGAPGWIGLRCTDEAMAVWLMRAIIVENVAVRREDAVLWLPAGPAFQIDQEIKNVVTVVAKTHHYWMEHLTAVAA